MYQSANNVNSLLTDTPLLIDLDNTFILNDSYISDCQFIWDHNKRLFFKSIFFYCTARRAKAKFILAEASLKNSAYQYNLNTSLLREIQNKLSVKILITGANYLHAAKICQNYPIFNFFVASDELQIVSVAVKIKWVKQFNLTQFDYAGDKFVDRKLFKLAKMSYVVKPSFLLCLWLKYFFTGNYKIIN